MYLCLDIGATKTLLAIFSETGHRLRYLKFPTPQHPKAFTSNLATYLGELLPVPSRFPIERVIIAVPATLKNGQPAKFGNLPWKDFPFTTAVSVCIKNLFNHPLPLSYLNDADAAVLYESSLLDDATGLTLYLTFSTGIGGGLARDGRLTSSSATFEPGHRRYSFQGKRQEWEDFASAAAIRQVYHRKVTRLHDPAILDDIATRLTPGLTSLIRKYHPDRIILGGPLALTLPRYLPQLETNLRSALKIDQLPPLLPAARPTASTIYGCYTYGSKF